MEDVFCLNFVVSGRLFVLALSSLYFFVATVCKKLGDCAWLTGHFCLFFSLLPFKMVVFVCIALNMMAVNMVLNVHRNHRDSEKGGKGVRRRWKREIIYIS